MGEQARRAGHHPRRDQKRLIRLGGQLPRPGWHPARVLRPAELTCRTANFRLVIAIEEFRSQSAAWIASHAAAAPPDYGAICPHHLLDRAIDWQRAINDAGYAGIH